MTFGVNIIPKDNTVSLGTSQNKWKINGVDDPKLTDTTYSNATTSAAGLMSATDKTKLDGITAGAAVTSVNNQTGAVSITPANIGAVGNTGFQRIAGELSLRPSGSEGGQITLEAPSDHPERAGIVIDQQGTSNFRIFGKASADGTSITGAGTTLDINPYAKTITGGYTFTGNVTGTASENVAKSGDTMTGVLTLKGSQYSGPSGAYGMNANNSDIINVNAIYHSNPADNFSEGHLFYHSATTWDAMAANDGTFYFGSNVEQNANLTGNATLKAGRLILTASQDASGTSANPVALIVGSEQTGSHLEFDGNEIIAKSDGTHGATLYLNNDGGGVVDIGSGGLQVAGNIIQPSGYINGENASNTHHAIKLGHNGDDTLKFFEYGGQFDFYASRSGTNTLIGQFLGINDLAGSVIRLKGNYINANSKNAFKTATNGSTDGSFISLIRGDSIDSIADFPKYSSGVAFGVYDTFGYIMTSYDAANIRVGGGSLNKLNWTAKIYTDADTIPIPHGGTNATTAAGARENLDVLYTPNDFYSSFASLPNEHGIYMVSYSKADPDAPIKTSEAWWWNVIQIGILTRYTQIATCPFRYRECIFIRHRHDNNWTEWVQFLGTAMS